MPGPTDVTEILASASRGDESAVNRLLPLVYDQLRRLAQHQLAGERPDHTLQATALVHEAYLKLVDQTRVEWQNRAHFFAVAAQAIRRILVDHARTRGRQKRGGDLQRVTLTESTPIADGRPLTDLVAIDEALEKLAREHPKQARVVEMRFYAGLKNREVAEVLGVTTRTVEAYWQFARAWLFDALGDGAAQNGV